MNPPRGRRPVRLGELLRERLRELGWERRLTEEELLVSWEHVVGPQIAAHACPSHVQGRRLTVTTESPVWAQQLALLKPDLLRRIARRFGPELVTDLYFVTGRIERSAPPEAPASPEAPPPELPSELASELEAIPDAEVREAVRRLCRASLARRPGRPPESA